MSKTKKRDERLPMWADSWVEVAAKVPTLEHLTAIKQNTIEWLDTTEEHPKHRGIDVLELKALAFDEILVKLQQVNKNKATNQLMRTRFGFSSDPDDHLSQLYEAVAPLLS